MAKQHVYDMRNCYAVLFDIIQKVRLSRFEFKCIPSIYIPNPLPRVVNLQNFQKVCCTVIQPQR